MATFKLFLESQGFGFETAVEMYYRLGGDGKKSVNHPNLLGFYIHPNGIVSSDLPEGNEQQPMFDPRKLDHNSLVPRTDIVKRDFLIKSISAWK